MYARMAKANIVSGKADELITKLREVALATYQGHAGFEGALALMDRENEVGILITLWESEAACSASQAATTHRPQLDDVREAPEFSYYEVVARL